MIAVFADTHRDEGHGLSGRAFEAAVEATTLVHAGDFTTEAVYEAFAAVGGDLHAVYGNNDPPSLRSRLPSEVVLETEGIRVAVVHGHEHTDQALSLLGRDRAVDVVVSGHSHRPRIVQTEAVVLLNPGSHSRPRQFEPGYAELRPTGEGGEARILDPGGADIESVRFEVEGR